MRATTGLALGIALGIGLGSPALARDLPDIKKAGRLRVVAVLEEKEPEFLSMKAGATPGFDHEILAGFCHQHGLVLEFVLVPSWDALVPALQAGKGDLIAGRVSDTPVRRRYADFTNEVFPTRVLVVTRSPRPAVTDAQQLAVLKVGTIPGTSMAEAVAGLGIPPQRIVPLSAGALSGALREGRVEAAVWAVEGAILAQRKDPSLQLGVFLGPPQKLAYGLGKGQPRLLAALNDHIRMVKQTGAWHRLVVKYFGAAAPEILAKARRAE